MRWLQCRRLQIVRLKIVDMGYISLATTPIQVAPPILATMTLTYQILSQVINILEIRKISDGVTNLLNLFK